MARILKLFALAVNHELDWNDVTGTSATGAINNGYGANNAAEVTVSLPTTATLGDKIGVIGVGAGGWKISQAASQSIQTENDNSTTGTGGSATGAQYTYIELMCIDSGNTWVIVNSEGSFTLT